MFNQMNNSAEFSDKVNEVSKKHREAVYGFNKLANGVTEDGKISEESKNEMLGYLNSIPKADRVYVVKDESFMEVVEYVLTTTDKELSEKYEGRVGEAQLKLYEGDDIEDVTLALFKEVYSKLATSGDEISVPDSSEIIEALMVGYYIFYAIFVLGLTFLLPEFLFANKEE